MGYCIIQTPSLWMSQTFIYDPSIMSTAKFHTAIAKIQALARSKRAKQTTATLGLNVHPFYSVTHHSH